MMGNRRKWLEHQLPDVIKARRGEASAGIPIFELNMQKTVGHELPGWQSGRTSTSRIGSEGEVQAFALQVIAPQVIAPQVVAKEVVVI
jgi:hypothetical protein